MIVKPLKYIDFSQVILKNQQNSKIDDAMILNMFESDRIFSFISHSWGEGGKAEFTDDCEPSID
jgi:hypothetical protein